MLTASGIPTIFLIVSVGCEYNEPFLRPEHDVSVAGSLPGRQTGESAPGRH